MTGVQTCALPISGYDIVFVNEFFKPFQDAYIYSRKQTGIKAPKYGYANTDANSYLNENKKDLAGYIDDARTDGSL